jgi:hypothetical protein
LAKWKRKAMVKLEKMDAWFKANGIFPGFIV